MRQDVREKTPLHGSGERGLAMLSLLVAAVLVTVISVSLVSLMNTDMTHASIEYAASRSFYVAQTGLEEAKAHIFAAPDPASDATPAAGVTEPYGGGQFTYWVDAGPAVGCGDGFKTLEARGEVVFLGRTVWTEVRACGVPGTPFLATLFGVSRVQFQGAASRVYLAPYQIGTPGGGGSLGSFTEVNFANQESRVNALSEETTDTVTLRDGVFFDYSLYGFPVRPDYNPSPATDATPWIVSVFGDLIKAQPSTGPLPNRCGTPYACLTVADRVTDIQRLGDLRGANYVHRVYLDRIRAQTLPPLVLHPETFQTLAGRNAANAELNRIVGLRGKTDSFYERMQFYRLLFYLASHPAAFLRGPVYVDGTIELLWSVKLGGDTGDVTIAVGGDLIIDKKLTLTNTHDRSTAMGRQVPGILVLGSSEPSDRSTEVCAGERVNGSGRLVLCEGSTLTVDGLIYTRDGMAIEPGASLDQIGAMYHDNRGTPNPSFTTRDATVVLRFDPLALSVFGQGMTMVSWQQLH